MQASLKQWQVEVFSIICAYVNIAPGYHPHQLHLEEYTLIQCMEAISNINFQLLVVRKPVKVEAANADHDANGDDDLLRDNDSFGKKTNVLVATRTMLPKMKIRMVTVEGPKPWSS